MNNCFDIAGIKIKNPLVLAPMAGYTDYSFRTLCSEYGAGLEYTEMQSVDSIIHNSKETIKDLKDTYLDKKNNNETKLSLQIFGGNLDTILESIPLFEKYATYDFLDFNCGCPVNKVIKQRAGSFWLNREDELIELLKKMKKVSSKPITVKVRIGFSSLSNIVPLCKKIENTGVSCIAVHGRTRNEFFSSDVHYDVIKDIKKNLSIPIIANGNINEANFTQVMSYTNCDAAMIGQSSLGYPYIFKNLLNIIENKPQVKHDLNSQLNDLTKHLNLVFKYKDERQAASIMRGFSIKYLKGFDDVKTYKVKLTKSNSKIEYINIIDEMMSKFN